jgi:uroporphyrinogen III methyltransferase/synthase
MKMKKPKVYLVGVGPGDPGLLTVKAKELIQSADVIVYDRLVSDAIVELFPMRSTLLYVGKDPNGKSVSQDEIHECLRTYASTDKQVVRLKGGDPFVFGRGGEEAAFLSQNDIDFEFVPGITSAIAVPEYAGIPVTHRGYSTSFAVIAGHTRENDSIDHYPWDSIAKSVDTLVFLMGVKNLPIIVNHLLSAGKDPKTPIAIIEKGTTPKQRTITGTLNTIVHQAEKEKIHSPSIIVVGNTVLLQPTLHWLDHLPLWDKTILVTRSTTQEGTFRKKLNALGADVISLPSIQITRLPVTNDFVEDVKQIQDFPWILFSSVNSVKLFFEEFFQHYSDVRALHKNRIACMGPSTEQELLQYGIRADLVPNRYVAESLWDSLQMEVQPGHKILLPRAKNARNFLVNKLQEAGCEVHEHHLYESTVNTNHSTDDIEKLLSKPIDVITFTSASCVHNFMKIIPVSLQDKILQHPAVCIGPITAEALKEYDWQNIFISELHTIDGMCDTIIKMIKTNLQRG